MKSKIPTIIRSTALVLPVAFAIGWWIDGPYLGTSAVLAGLLTLVNLKILGWVSSNYLGELGAGRDPGLWGLALSTKWLVTGPCYGVLMLYTPPIAVGIGLSTVLMALPIAALIHDSEQLVPTPVETR